jgi:hypothetical protein
VFALHPTTTIHLRVDHPVAIFHQLLLYQYL